MSDEKPEDGDQQDTSQETSGDTSHDTSEDSEGISDDQLPEDVQPSEENPLARHPEQTGDSDDEIGADTEGEPDTAPLTQEDSDYGHPGESGA